MPARQLPPASCQAVILTSLSLAPRDPDLLSARPPYVRRTSHEGTASKTNPLRKKWSNGTV